jgi:hypothetical protein
MIWLSEKRDVFRQNFLQSCWRKFYVRRRLISGVITVRLKWMMLCRVIVSLRIRPNLINSTIH